MNDATPWIDPELVAAGQLLQSRGLVAPDRTQASLSEVRAAVDRIGAFLGEGSVPLRRERDLTLPGPHGQVPCRLYLPDDAEKPPLIVYAHGGGFMQGSLPSWDAMLRELVRQSGVAALSVDYKLSPEHRFPVAFEEMLAMLRLAAREGSEFGIDPTRLAVGGDSAGANLALATCLQLDASERRAVKLQLLYYGTFGLADSASRRAFGNETDGLTKAGLDYFRDCLLRSPADAEDMRYDCLSGDLRGLPPAFIVATDVDPLLDDSRALAQLLEVAGVTHELIVYEGVLHGFLHLSRMVSKSMQAVDAGAAALRKALAL